MIGPRLTGDGSPYPPEWDGVESVLTGRGQCQDAPWINWREYLNEFAPKLFQ